MFTGIVQEQIKILERKESDTLLSFVFSRPQEGKLGDGESVLLNGICSTVTNVSAESFVIDYMLETRKKTTVDGWSVGDHIHYEPSLRVGDQFGGHFVFGHIDTVGTAQKVVPTAVGTSVGTEDIIICIPPKFLSLLIPKGSVAIDGVSLTVVNVKGNSFSVSLIPHTLTLTHFGKLKEGDSVNIEFDMLAKYMQRAVSSK